MINYLDLFSGIGGFALGAYWAGFKCDKHYYSEIEKYPAELYQLRFPDSIALGDITKIDFESLKDGNDWIITGGFPCQDISVAGKGAGIEGSRSGLWFEYWRAIRILRPRFAIIENVGAITIRGLDRVLGSLAEIGYDAEWQDIRAEDMGAPHRRERIWIVANPSSLGRSTGFNNEREYENNISEIRETEKDKQSGNFGKRGIEQVCTDTREISNPSIQRLQGQKSKRKRSEQPGLSDECNWWSTESDVGRLANGVPRRMDKLKGLGNSIVPQIAQVLFMQIMLYIKEPT